MRLGVVEVPLPINKCIYHLASHKSSLERPRLDFDNFQNSLEMRGCGIKSISKITARQTYNLKVFWSPVTVSRREALIKKVKKSTQRAAKHLQKLLSVNKAHLGKAVQSSSVHSNTIKPTANQDNLSKCTA